MSRRSLARLVAGAALAGSTVALVVAGPVPAAAQEAPARTATIALAQQPNAVGSTGAFPVFVTVTGAPEGSAVVVDTYPRAESLGDLATTELVDPDASYDPVPVGAPDDDGDQSAGFALQLYRTGDDRPDTAFRLKLDQPGVYPLRIRLIDADEARLATLVTSLIRLPDEGQAVTTTEVAVVTTVHADPPSDAAARAGTGDLDPALAEALDPVLAAFADRPTLPATFSVTPDTAVRLTTDPTTLAALKTELGRPGRELLDAPYVDLDPASLVAADLDAELGRQRNLGRRTLTEVLEEPETGTWALQRPIDTAALSALRTRGIYRFLLAPKVATGGDARGPVRLPAGGEDVQAIVADDDLAIGTAPGTDPVLAAHDLLARLSLGPGSTPGAAVVSIDPAAADPTTLGLVLDALALGSPYFSAHELSDLFDSVPDRSAAPSLVAPDPERLGSYPSEVVASHAAVASYASMVGDRPDLLAPFQRPLALSAAADLSLDQRRRDLAEVTDRLAPPFAAVEVPASDKVTLGARKTDFPLPVTSTSDDPIQVLVEVESNDRLEFPDGPKLTTLAKGQQTVKIAVVSKAPGDTPVRITVRTPDGRVVLAESRYTFRSTAVSGMGLALTIGAGAFLALWWGRHWHRNRKVARHARHRHRPARPEPV